MLLVTRCRKTLFCAIEIVLVYFGMKLVKSYLWRTCRMERPLRKTLE